ncbi:MAG: helicase, partial [Oscillospiraceae bacterium]|nr:helicase [Oscillospiraceae bacterium]
CGVGENPEITSKDYLSLLGVYTKMTNVAGIGTQESSDRANDMYMKCRYMDEITDRKGVVFATGTPISNSMSELYTVCKYLAYDRLQQDGLLSFDAWAGQYGQTVSTMELAPEGTGYRSRTRFAKFVNLPELMSMYHDFADVKLADDLNLNVPEAIYETIVAERSPEQAIMMQELSQRASAIRSGVDPSVDNMLKVSNDGRKLGLDQRLIDPTLPDHEYSKVNLCVKKVYEIWDESREERAAQMVFCDSSTPNPDKFNVYDDMKVKLIAAGVPQDEIAFIHDAKTKEAKQQLFTKVRNGEVRILFGSTSKMGAGTNAQDRLLALHNLDCPWVPSSLEQRAGRIIRQGNRYKQVKLFNYVTNGSFDSYLWQTVENKQKFIGQVMSGKTPVRSCEDVDEVALSYAEVKALCIGNPLIKVRAELDTDLTRLKMLKSTWQREQYRLSDQVSKILPASISSTKALIERLTPDAAQAEQTKEAGYESFTILGKTYIEQKNTEAALLTIVGDMPFDTPKYVGEWRGFRISAIRVQEGFEDLTNIIIRGKETYTVKVTSQANLSKIRKTLDGIPKRLEQAKGNLVSLIGELKTAKETLEQPWAYEEEFQEKTARLIEVDAELAENADKEPPMEQKVIVMPNGQEQPVDTAELPSFNELLEEGQRLAAELNQRAEAKQQSPTLE